jgi:hypothetical protein
VILVGKDDGKRHLQNLGADGKIISNGPLENPLEWSGRHSYGSRQEQEDKNVPIL